MQIKKSTNCLRIVTWNINSVRLRIGLVEKLAQEHKPDIICLQETKASDEVFPTKAIEKMGYKYQHIQGMKSYNGLAILSKIPLIKSVIHHRVGKQDCRHIACSIELNGKMIDLHNLYIPAGGDIPDVALNDKFGHKVDFVQELTEFWMSEHKPTEYLIAVGDFNIAPLEHDVWSHKKLLTVVSHTPIEVKLLNEMQDSIEWVDAMRHFVPNDQKLYSWWSYRSPNWQTADLGRRLDHIWVTPPLKAALKHMYVLRDARAWDQPSDHVPVVLDIDVTKV
jgi:exodeoxyribonuclease-3